MQPLLLHPYPISNMSWLEPLASKVVKDGLNQHLTIGMLWVQMQMQMGGAQPMAPPSGPNFFSLPPGGAGGMPAYPSMDPLQSGTRMPPPRPMGALLARLLHNM